VLRRCALFSRFVLLIAALITSQQVLSHSGGLNSAGCHAGSKPYHCHRAQNEMVGNRLRCDLGSKSAECNGSGATIPSQSQDFIKTKKAVATPTFQYKPAVPDLYRIVNNSALRSRAVKLIQKRLVLYSLYKGKVDGVIGMKTANAIDLFKIKNGYKVGGYLDELTLQQFGVYELIFKNGELN